MNARDDILPPGVSAAWGGWPSLVRNGNDFIVEARYLSSRRLHNLTWPAWPVVIVAGTAFFLAYFINPIFVKMAYKVDLRYYKEVDYVALFISWYLIYWSIKEWLKKQWLPRFRITFSGDPASPYAAVWRNLDGVVTITREYPREFRVSPHRLGRAEGRALQRLAVGNPYFKPPQNPLWQMSSEVFIHTGPRLANWYLVAEIAEDEDLLKAGQVAAALDFADKAAEAWFLAQAAKERVPKNAPRRGGAPLD